MRLITCALAFLLIVGCSSARSSEQTINQLQLQGQPYFTQLVATGEYDALLESIEQGDKKLIAVAPQLARWADAANAEGLKIVLSRAVTKQPEAVMRLIPETYSVTDLCTIPYIEESLAVELKHINNALKALQNAKEQSSARTECINIYKELNERLAK